MISHDRWVPLADKVSPAEAEVLKGLLESQGIPVYIAREGAGRALGLVVGPLGLAQVLVPASRRSEARQVYQAFLEGRWAVEEPPEGDAGIQGAA